MRKVSAKSMKDDLRPEYDLTKLKGGVRGKYYQRARVGTNLVLVEPDLAKAFPDASSVNRALRALLNAVGATTGSSTRPRRGNVSLKKTIRKRAAVTSGARRAARKRTAA
jgi:hypothetical protein